MDLDVPVKKKTMNLKRRWRRSQRHRRKTERRRLSGKKTKKKECCTGEQTVTIGATHCWELQGPGSHPKDLEVSEDLHSTCFRGQWRQNSNWSGQRGRTKWGSSDRGLGNALVKPSFKEEKYKEVVRRGRKSIHTWEELGFKSSSDPKTEFYEWLACDCFWVCMRINKSLFPSFSQNYSHEVHLWKTALDTWSISLQSLTIP